MVINLIEARKIGCDRTIPSCNNCLRTRRSCNGYGLRLVWPEKSDGRRKQKGALVSNNSHYFIPVCTTGYTQLLNVGFEDLAVSKDEYQRFDLSSSTNQLDLHVLPWNPALKGQDGAVLSYCELQPEFCERSALTFYRRSHYSKLDFYN